MASATISSPLDECSAISIKRFVVPASAETTTTGCRSRRPRMMAAVRAIASASPTEVPPNLATIIRDPGESTPADR